MTLYTCSYRAWKEEMGVPVRTSVGAPRSFPSPLLEWPTVYPWGLLEVTDEAEFRRRYRHQLHRKTPKILAELVELQEGYAPLPLVLLCFEPAPKFCHRRVLGEWISQHTGEPIEER